MSPLSPVSPPSPGPVEPSDERIAVLGGGIVGVCCALSLARAGHGVDLIEVGEPGGPQAASYGNGGWISPASVVPMSTPGLLSRLPGLLADPGGPLVIRPSAMPGLAPWLWRFVRAGATLPRVESTSDVLASLLRDAPSRHLALAAAAGVPDAVRATGLLYAYRDDAALAADALAWHLRRRAGLVAERLEGALLRATAPGLSEHYALAMRVPAGAHCPDPGAYTAALQAHAIRLGVRRVQAQVIGLRQAGGRLVGLVLQQPAPREWPVRRAVIAAGIGSAALLRTLGGSGGGAAFSVPLASERGYHLVLPGCLEWPQPVMPSDGRMAVTLTPQGLRVAGQVELATVAAPPDWRRVRVLWHHARKVLSPRGLRALGLDASALGSDEPPASSLRWMGHRPSTPDGLPALGPIPGCEGLHAAFGHGHSGLATAPVTAEILCAWMDGGEAAARRLIGDAAVQALSAARFA